MNCGPKGRALYISYFGLREPLVQTQVLPYLRGIIDGGFEVTLLTFEPDLKRAWTEEEAANWRARLEAEGVRWLALPYHKRPSLPATVYDILNGARLAARLLKREQIDILHARGYVPAAMGAIARRMAGGRLLFDIRGLMPEEYVDAGIWPEAGYLYRLVKRAERRLLAAADGFVVLTEKARDILFPGCLETDARGRPIEVIPCCVDTERFQEANSIPREEVREEMGLRDRRVIVYLGALGGWYLTDEMTDFLAAAHSQDTSTFSMILTQSPPEMIEPRLKDIGLLQRDYLIKKVAPADVPRYLRASDMALSFIKPCYSKLASSPTKIAEYLAAGLPVVCNRGIGDLDETIESDRVGVIIRSLDRDSYIQALLDVEALQRDGGLADRCRASASGRFGLKKVGGEKYRRLYSRLIKTEEPGAAVSQSLCGMN
ncbi:MAG TPA: glycosyltransferase [Blastocatellia bacterium]|nr:glycosyltransferase [Blastocatellia bacterium]